MIYRPLDTRRVPGEEEVNFERVTKVYREESGKKTLVNLEADFYDKLAAYVARLDAGIRAFREHGRPPEEVPRGRVRPSPARDRSHPVNRAPATERSRPFEGTG